MTKNESSMWNIFKGLFSRDKEIDEGVGKTILIIEDTEVDMRLIEKSFSKTKYKILKATDGEVGIQIAQNKSPNLIILDCMLPKLRGEEVCRRLKESEKTKHIPIVILTVVESNILDCYEAGATKYINKPIYPKTLLSEVKDALENPGSLMSDEDTENG